MWELIVAIAFVCYCWRLVQALNTHEEQQQSDRVVFKPKIYGPTIVIFPKEGYLEIHRWPWMTRRIALREVTSLQGSEVRFSFTRTGSAGTAHFQVWKIVASSHQGRRLFTLSLPKQAEVCYELGAIARLLGVTKVNGQELPEILLVGMQKPGWLCPGAREQMLAMQREQANTSRFPRTRLSLSLEEGEQKTTLAIKTSQGLVSALALASLGLFVGFLALQAALMFPPADIDERMWKNGCTLFLLVLLPAMLFCWEQCRSTFIQVEVSADTFSLQTRQPFHPQIIGDTLVLVFVAFMMWLLPFVICVVLETSALIQWLLSAPFIGYVVFQLGYAIWRLKRGVFQSFSCPVSEICDFHHQNSYRGSYLVVVLRYSYQQIYFPYPHLAKPLLIYLAHTIRTIGMQAELT